LWAVGNRGCGEGGEIEDCAGDVVDWEPGWFLKSELEKALQGAKEEERDRERDDIYLIQSR
jgi:hypothetical protein